MNSNNQVKQLRLQRAWSQEQLAEMAGLSVRTIQRIENGERPGLETLSALAAVFEVTVAEIGGEASREGAPGPEASLDLRIEEAKARVQQESRFFRSLSVALVVCVLLALLNRYTNPQYTWSGWVALIWGALLAVRGLRLFVFGEWIKNWRQARLQRLLRKWQGNRRLERRRSVQIVTRARTPSVSISPPLPCWTMAPRDITR